MPSQAFLRVEVPPQLPAAARSAARSARQDGADDGARAGEAVRALCDAALAVKDVFDVAGMPTNAGSPEWGRDEPPPRETARAVAVLLAAGARVVGKTVSDELAFSLMGRNRHYPAPVNRAAPDRVTGGSSSGSAAAVGWGEAAVATATDTGGSIRAPASFCGLMGLRTTHGRVPMEGCVPLAPSFDTSGWFAADPVLYRATALASLTGPHAPLSARPRARVLPSLEALVEPSAAAEWSRIRDLAFASLAPPVPLDVGVPLDDLYWCFRRLQAVEAWFCHGPFVHAHGGAMNPDVRARFEWARQVTRPEHGEAMTLRRSFAAWLADELEPDDVLVMPTMPGPAPLVDADDDALGDMRERALRMLCMAGLTGLPQITLPLGTVEGAPFGLSLIGGRNTDVALIDLGTAIMERAGARQCVASQGT